MSEGNDLIFEELEKVSDRFELEHDKILRWAPFYLVDQDGFIPDLSRELNALRQKLEDACIFTPRKGDVLQLYTEYNAAGKIQFRDANGTILTDLVTWIRRLFLAHQTDDAIIAIYLDENDDIPNAEEIWEEMLRILFAFKRTSLCIFIGSSRNMAHLKKAMEGSYFYREIQLESPDNEENIVYFLGELDRYHVPYVEDKIKPVLQGWLSGKGWQDRKALVLLRCDLNWRIGTGAIDDSAEAVEAFLKSEEAGVYFRIKYADSRVQAHHIGFIPVS